MDLSPKTKFATFPQRLFAFNIDFLAFLICAVLLSFLIKHDHAYWGTLFGVVCFYHAGLESSQWQATLGKKYAHIKVVNIHGSRLSLSQAFLRIITKYLSLLLFFGGFFMIYFRRDRRGLHDVLVKTYVVSVENMDNHVGNSHK